ncbi:hypothetical protein ACWKSP_09435 [Micromonosporaceae bacterium Da 78-11]
MTTRYERLKMQRRMQRRIRLVVEERRMSLTGRPVTPDEPVADLETTVEIPPLSALFPAPIVTPAPMRAVGRVTITSA